MAAYESYLETRERLRVLVGVGRGNSPAADKIREQLDELWLRLTNEERGFILEDQQERDDVVG